MKIYNVAVTRGYLLNKLKQNYGNQHRQKLIANYYTKILLVKALYKLGLQTTKDIDL